MSPTLLALFGMFCWGISPVFAKLGLQGIDPITGLCARTMIASVIVSSYMVLLARAHHFTAIPLKALLLIAIEAIFATIVGDLAYYAALRRGNCGQVSMILSASPAITVALSAVLLSERPSLSTVVGALMVTGGLILVSLRK